MSVSDAKKMAKILWGAIAGVKANDLLDTAGAPVLNEIANPSDIRMADPKIHDIPKTVYNRVRKYDGLADFVTVHGCNSFKALVQAKNASRDNEHKTNIIVITVTTDIDSGQCHSIFGTYGVKNKVRQLVHRAKMAGLHGIVCSPKEVRTVRAMWPSAIIITPGVRSPGENTHDQLRVDTPEKAVADGADYIVCGREIAAADNQILAAQRINRGAECGEMVRAAQRLD